MTHHTTSTTHHTSTDTTSDTTGDTAAVVDGVPDLDTTDNPAATQQGLDAALDHVRAATSAMLTDLDGPGIWEAATLHTITADLIAAGAHTTTATVSGTASGRASGVVSGGDGVVGAARAARDALATIPDEQRSASVRVAFGELNRIAQHQHHTTSDQTSNEREVRA